MGEEYLAANHRNDLAGRDHPPVPQLPDPVTILGFHPPPGHPNPIAKVGASVTMVIAEVETSIRAAVTKAVVAKMPSPMEPVEAELAPVELMAG
ncbi:MAG: hypothetical protein V3T23_03595 [Nitrososphaerales archaeon]